MGLRTDRIPYNLITFRWRTPLISPVLINGVETHLTFEAVVNTLGDPISVDRRSVFPLFELVRFAVSQSSKVRPKLSIKPLKLLIVVATEFLSKIV